MIVSDRLWSVEKYSTSTVPVTAAPHRTPGLPRRPATKAASPPNGKVIIRALAPVI